MVSDGAFCSSSISWFPGALKTGTPAVLAMSLNSLYCFCMRLGLSGCFPEMVSPVQSTKAAAGLNPLTAANIFPGVGGCEQVLCAGRLSPAITKANFVGSVGFDNLPVWGRGESAGIWPKAAVQQSWKAKIKNG